MVAFIAAERVRRRAERWSRLCGTPVSDVIGSDIADGADFLHHPPPTRDIGAIITNPPYALAREFIEHALHLDGVRVVAMLLRADFDHAATRAHLFADCAMFAKKVVLTKRIRWFQDSTGSPSFNHCWMIWDRQHRCFPTLAYAGGIAQYARSGRAGNQPPDVREPRLHCTCATLTQRRPLERFAVNSWEEGSGCPLKCTEGLASFARRSCASMCGAKD
jgi:hypothetical protein